MTRTRTRLLAGAFVVLAAGPGSAQDFRVTGHVEADHITYFEPGQAARRAGRHEMIAQIDGRASFGRRIRLVGSVDVRGDFADHARDRVHVDELYAEVAYGSFDLRAGRQIIAWGKTDLVNPTDRLSPRDFTDPLESDDERLGVFAVRPRVQWGPLQVEGAIVPMFTGSIMPGQRSRWSPSLASRPQSALQPDSMRLEYQVLPTRKPATALANVQYATRVSGSVHGWDVSASYFDGWGDVPHVGSEVSISSAGVAAMRIRPEHLRERMVGGDVATVVGPFTVRAEAAYITPDPQRGPEYFQYVIGAERTVGDLMAGGGTFVLVQWIQSVVPGTFQAAPLDFDYLFQKATMARVQHNITAAAQIGVEWLHEWERGGYYLQPSASYRFGGRVRIEALVDLLDGREGQFFGLFANNKRFQSRVRYSF